MTFFICRSKKCFLVYFHPFRQKIMQVLTINKILIELFPVKLKKKKRKKKEKGNCSVVWLLYDKIWIKCNSVIRIYFKKVLRISIKWGLLFCNQLLHHVTHRIHFKWANFKEKKTKKEAPQQEADETRQACQVLPSLLITFVIFDVELL